MRRMAYNFLRVKEVEEGTKLDMRLLYDRTHEVDEVRKPKFSAELRTFHCCAPFCSALFFLLPLVTH